MSVLRMCLWSGPRNVSTALMYSFAQRSDTVVVDEPLYGHYLAVTDVEHPGRDEVLQDMETDGERVVRRVILGPCERPVLFMKQMAHHLVAIDRGFLAHTVNVLLIRDPREVLLSLMQQIPEPVLRDTGIAVQSALFDELQELGQEAPVIDSRELLLDPEHVLRELLERAGLEFDAAMLAWDPGPRKEDGVWAPHWYANVHRSSGFAPYRTKAAKLPQRLEGLLAECRPHYERLMQRAIRARSGKRGVSDA